MAIRRAMIWVSGGVLLLLTLACNEVGTATPAGYRAPVLTTPRPTDDFLPAAEAARLAVIMTATAEADATRQVQAQAAATATAESYLLEVARIQATATAAAIQATATAEARAWEATATAEARASAEAEAARALAATATAQAYAPTATVEALQVQATATAVAQEAELRGLAVERERQRAEGEAEREEMLRPIMAYGPWVVVGLAVAVVVYGLLRLIVVAELRARAIPRDARGDAPLMVLQQGWKRLVVYDGDRAFGPAAVIDAEEVRMPALAEETQQAAVTMRDQAVDLATRGLPRAEARGSSGQARRAAAQRMGAALPGGALQVRVIEPGQVRGWLREVTPQALTAVLEGVGDE